MNTSKLGLAVAIIGGMLLGLCPATGTALEEPVSADIRAVQQKLPESRQPDVQAPRLAEAVNQFIEHVAAQAGFESWRQASWTSQPLGPGTHGWIILLQSGGQEIGYMVVHAAGPDTYRLTEYGLGPYPLFSLQTLYRSLVQLELISSDYTLERLYLDPLHAVWQVTARDQQAPGIVYIDAKTGEQLPLDSIGIAHPNPMPPLAGLVKPFTNVQPAHTITASEQLPPFDVYGRLSWVGKTPPAAPPFDTLKEWLAEGQRVVVTTEPFGKRIMVPFPVTGYQVWSGGEAFIRVQQDDDRFIPFSLLQESGAFFP